ncbi:hypothetical protein CRYUN_Cryun17cG0134900 [Craigia yunnanensis]
MGAENGKETGVSAESPFSVLEDEYKCKEEIINLEEGTVLDAKNGDTSLLSEAMVKEEEKLMEARLKEQAKQEEPEEAVHLNDTQFTRLDGLLTQAQMYSEFLLEKMDDITFNVATPEAAQTKRGRGSKRRAANQYNNLKGVKWLISLWQNGLNGILADQMGLGKTIQTIAFLAHLKGNGMDGPYLVIAPLSTLSNWINEIERFAPSMNAFIYHGNKKEKDEIRRKHMPKVIGPKFPIVVTSYEMGMCDARKSLKHYEWKYVVVDEGHRLKNSNCKLVKELKHLHAGNKLLLTGTPLQNNLAELWSLLNFILPDIFQSHEEFESWFDFLGKINGEVSKEEIEEKRRAQGNFQDHLLNKTLEAYLQEKVDTGRGIKGKLNNLMIQLRKNCNHPDLLESAFDGSCFYPPVEQIVEQCGKFYLLDRLLARLFERKHKVLIFSQSTKILDIMDYYFIERGFKVCRIDGSVKLEDRRRQIQEFNDLNSNYRAFILSTRAGGLGINLTAADTCVLYDSDWEEDLLALLQNEDTAEDKMVQTDTSDEELEKILDRSDLIVDSDDGEKAKATADAVSLKGPGWEGTKFTFFDVFFVELKVGFIYEVCHYFLLRTIKAETFVLGFFFISRHGLCFRSELNSFNSVPSPPIACSLRAEPYLAAYGKRRCRSDNLCSQAPFCLCTREPISVRSEETFAHFCYFLEGLRLIELST